MGNMSKHLTLLMLAALGMPHITKAAIPAQNSKEDLYSESIYLHKSSAETPTSLESNARKEEEPAPMEASAENSDPQISVRDLSKKSSSN